MGTGAASLWGMLLAQRLHGCWHGCKHSECMAVGKVASTTSASLWALLQSRRRHRCGHHFFFARGRTPMAGVCFLPAVTSGLAARSTKCHRLAATMHGIDELVAPTTPTYVSRLYLTTHSTIRTGFVSTGRDNLTRNSYHHFCKQRTIL